MYFMKKIGISIDIITSNIVSSALRFKIEKQMYLSCIVNKYLWFKCGWQSENRHISMYLSFLLSNIQMSNGISAQPIGSNLLIEAKGHQRKRWIEITVANQTKFYN